MKPSCASNIAHSLTHNGSANFVLLTLHRSIFDMCTHQSPAGSDTILWTLCACASRLEFSFT